MFISFKENTENTDTSTDSILNKAKVATTEAIDDAAAEMDTTAAKEEVK